jgi:hypothetical protein
MSPSLTMYPFPSCRYLPASCAVAPVHPHPALSTQPSTSNKHTPVSARAQYPNPNTNRAWRRSLELHGRTRRHPTRTLHSAMPLRVVTALKSSYDTTWHAPRAHALPLSPCWLKSKAKGRVRVARTSNAHRLVSTRFTGSKFPCSKFQGFPIISANPTAQPPTHLAPPGGLRDNIT